MSEFVSILIATLIQPLSYVVMPSERIYWGYLATAFIMAAGVYVVTRPVQQVTLKGMLAFCFPERVYKHPSAWKDVQFFVLNTILLTAFIFPAAAGLLPATSDAVYGLLGFLGTEGILGAPTLWSGLVATLVAALFFDFALYLQHYAFHRIPALWEFHKVHHSAEVLTPITVYRMHPLDIITAVVMSSMAIGLANGLFHHLYGAPVGVLNAFGLNILLVAFYIFGYNLRHSHVWVDYGPRWSRVFISPAQHQIHHSAQTRHWDKNMGFMLAFWDRLFGTLYVPEGQEEFVMGLDEREPGESENRRFDSLWGLFLYPFTRLLHSVQTSSQPQTGQMKGWVAAGLLVLLLGTAGWYNYARVKAVLIEEAVEVSDSVFLEELTWMEVRERLDEGHTTVIVPTGGVEQNGPHMVLGKHNYVVRHTAGEIARKLGKTLVAPVVAYVPEGRIDPPEGHMRFAGTLSVSESVFEGILESTARSLKAHGFRLICLIGDSGGNQEPQRVVADKLNREWADQDVRVLHVSDYYFTNGQRGWLVSNGFSPDAVGTHAGIRDTSEMLAVYPAGIREAARKRVTKVSLDETGADGKPNKASAELGERMLKLKIKAALRQIKREREAL